MTNREDAGAGSFAQAIADANATPGHDQIHFAIPNTGVQTIDVSRNELPEVTDPVTIDGYTQPGSKPNTLGVGNNATILIQIYGRGSSGSAEHGLVIMAPDSTVRGLSLGGFEDVYSSVDGPLLRHGYAIILNGAGDIVAGNFIGVAPDGRTPTLNGVGVYALSPLNIIGGTSPAARNVVSFNQAGIFADIYRDNVIVGNYVGTDATGMEQVGNGIGLKVGYCSGTRIGGKHLGAGNVISGNRINVSASGVYGTIQGNLIGLSADRSRTIGFGDGILEDSSSNGLFFTTIGGLEPGAANTIAGGNPIEIDSGYGNKILSNVIAGPDGILLGGAGKRIDLGDPDDGPNRLQNFPIITRVTRSGTNTEVAGGLNSHPAKSFKLQFFATTTSTADFSRLLGTRTLTTDGAGIAYFSYTFASELGENELVSATATDGEGNTSELSPVYSGVTQLANISTRGTVGVRDEILIGGLVIHQPRDSGAEFRKRVLIRALGPSLSVGGTPIAGRLEDPAIELFDSSGAAISSNDNWKTDQQPEIEATGVPPPADAESALITSLPDGSYTVHVRGGTGGTGVATVEIYDLDPLDPNGVPSGRLVNISTRGRVGIGANVLIGGYIVNGNIGQSILLRAIGPDLTAAGLSDALQDPVLELRDASGNLVASNDNWRDSQEAEIGATGLAPNDARDSAIRTTVIPGSYTAVVRGMGDTTGLALVEVYDLSQ